jgi:hypothetical protein
MRAELFAGESRISTLSLRKYLDWATAPLVLVQSAFRLALGCSNQSIDVYLALCSNVSAAKKARLEANQTVYAVHRAHTKAALIRWGAAGLIAAASLFAAGFWMRAQFFR